MKIPKSFEDRFRLAGWLIIAGLGVELLTLFWVHTFSFTLFITVGLSLTGAGMVFYLYSILTWEKQAP